MQRHLAVVAGSIGARSTADFSQELVEKRLGVHWSQYVDLIHDGHRMQDHRPWFALASLSALAFQLVRLLQCILLCRGHLMYS